MLRRRDLRRLLKLLRRRVEGWVSGLGVCLDVRRRFFFSFTRADDSSIVSLHIVRVVDGYTAYREPLLYNLQVGRELVKQVYIAERLQPPQWSTFVEIYKTRPRTLHMQLGLNKRRPLSPGCCASMAASFEEYPWLSNAHLNA